MDVKNILLILFGNQTPNCLHREMKWDQSKKHLVLKQLFRRPFFPFKFEMKYDAEDETCSKGNNEP